MKKSTLTLTLTLIACLLAGCDKRKGELTRSLAAEILNEQLARPSVTELQFNDSGIERAKSDGIIQASGPGMLPDYYFFTDKGLKMVSSVISENRTHYVPFANSSFRLKSPIGERVREVTGISAIQAAGVSSVDYVTDYLFPSELQPVKQYFFSGRKATATFRKYDDGWRVEND
jgi:hypothetical protein